MRWKLAKLAPVLLVVVVTWPSAGPKPANRFLAESSGDGRRSIVDVRSPPYTAVGRFTGSRICTGTLVLDPRIVVTAAHCVVETDGTLTRKAVAFQLDQTAGGDLATFRGHVERVGSTRQYTGHTSHDEPLDWAIVVLDRAPLNTKPLLLERVSDSAAMHLAKRISLAAFSVDVADGRTMSVDQGCSIVALRWDVFLHDCERMRGSSGAPLLVDTGEGVAVIGINTACIYERRPVEGEHIEMLHAAVSAASFEAAIRAVRDRLPPLFPTAMAVPR